MKTIFVDSRSLRLGRWLLLLFVIAATLSVAVPDFCKAQVMWHTRDTISVYTYPQLVYDVERAACVRYGSNRICLWDGIEWDQIPPYNPFGNEPKPEPSSSFLYYDSQSKRVMAYDDDYSDAWLWWWSGPKDKWTVVNWSAPTGFRHGAGVYDSHRGRLVLYGAKTAVGGGLEDGNRLAEYDGTQWFIVYASGPGPRIQFGMAYDEKRRVTVLFGGSRDLGTSDDDLGDTWTWDGTSWTLAASEGMGPAARNRPGMAFDHGLESVVLFGGNNDSQGSGLNDTWVWNGTEWNELQTTGPQSRLSPALAYDINRQDMLLYGGRYRTPQEWVDLGDTWILGKREVWVDPGYTGVETGAFDAPFNTLPEGLQAVPNNGRLRIMPANLNETPTVSKPMVIDAPLGTAIIGSP